MRIFSLLFLVVVFALSAQSQNRYTLPTSDLLSESAISRIDVYRQRLETLDHWETETIRAADDRLMGDAQRVAMFYLNEHGYTDSLVNLDEEGALTWCMGYDEQQRLIHMRTKRNDSTIDRWEVKSYIDSIRVSKWKAGRWVHSYLTDKDTILLRSRYRNETDSGVYIYDPIDERKVSEMYREGRLAIRTELDYLMKDGQPDSLYVKNDFYETAFETYWVSGAPKHSEGWVDVIFNGEAVVPESSPLYGSIETGFAFGDHRTQTRIITFPKQKIFSATTLTEESPIWPTFLPDGTCEREFYILHYNQRQ